MGPKALTYLLCGPFQKPLLIPGLNTPPPFGVNPSIKLISEKNVPGPRWGGGAQGRCGMLTTNSADFHQKEGLWIRAQSLGLASAHDVTSNKILLLCVPWFPQLPSEGLELLIPGHYCVCATSHGSTHSNLMLSRCAPNHLLSEQGLKDKGFLWPAVAFCCPGRQGRCLIPCSPTLLAFLFR